MTFSPVNGEHGVNRLRTSRLEVVGGGWRWLVTFPPVNGEQGGNRLRTSRLEVVGEVGVV